MRLQSRLFLCFFLLCGGQSNADSILAAVASNFSAPIREIAKIYEQQTGHRIKISIGSTGKQYAQIIQGAPFDIYFAADKAHPQKLESVAITPPETYAQGSIAFWHPGSSSPVSKVDLGNINHLAIANPLLAPYGVAAKEVLSQETFTKNLVTGDNISQTFQMIYSGAAQAGFVAVSQLIQMNISSKQYYIIPDDRYNPITQQAVVLTNNPIAIDFFNFVLRNDLAKQIILKSGYQLSHD